MLILAQSDLLVQTFAFVWIFGPAIAAIISLFIPKGRGRHQRRRR